jgi:hypothetical protein
MVTYFFIGHPGRIRIRPDLYHKYLASWIWIRIIRIKVPRIQIRKIYFRIQSTAPPLPPVYIAGRVLSCISSFLTLTINRTCHSACHCPCCCLDIFKFVLRVFYTVRSVEFCLRRLPITLPNVAAIKKITFQSHSFFPHEIQICLATVPAITGASYHHKYLFL